MSWIAGYRVMLSEEQSLQNAQMVANHFAGSWTPEAISALCGNMRHESSLNPDMYEFGYAWEDNRGYGLVQWTPRTKYEDWANAQGLPFREGDSQLARIDYEQANGIQWIQTSAYPLSFNDFTKSTQDIGYLTEAFTWNYERPNAQAGRDSMTARKAFAQRVYLEVDFSGSGAGGGGGSKPFFPTTPGLEITSKWAMRTLNGETSFHAAIDIGGGGVNHPVYATQSGEVVENVWHDISGWRLRIKHTGDTYTSQYIHLAVKSPLAVGTVVTKGQEVGTMGNTGGSYGIHLDFAISPDGNGFFTEAGTIDPEVYLQMTFGGGEGGSPGANKNQKLIKMLLAGTLPWGG